MIEKILTLVLIYAPLILLGAAMTSVMCLREMQIKIFYHKHDPTGKILKYGIADKIKTMLCGILFPLGIAIIIRDAIYNYRAKKIKKIRIKNEEFPNKKLTVRLFFLALLIAIILCALGTLQII